MADLVVETSPTFAGPVSSMSASAGDREPGNPLDNVKEEISGPTCTGEISKHVSTEAEQRRM